MYPFFETICLKNGELQNTIYHNERINRSLKSIYAKSDFYNIAEIIEIPDDMLEGIYKCRFMYSDSRYIYEFLPYQQMEVNYIQLVIHNNIEYKHKFTERKELDSLRENTIYDDVLISKRGLITDTTRANIIFKFEDKWVTPDSPLLLGTQRQKLIKENKIIKMEIKNGDLSKFQSFKLINAMCPMETQPELPINHIIV